VINAFANNHDKRFTRMTRWRAVRRAMKRRTPEQFVVPVSRLLQGSHTRHLD